MSMRSWSDRAQKIDTRKKVEKIEVRLVMVDTKGEVWFTDVMIQGGKLATIWSGHTSELQWSFDQ